MKNLITYLSKKSLSLGNGSGMTRKWFGNDSGMTRFSLASLICLCMLTIGSGNVWGAVDYIIPKLYLTSKNSPSGNTGWTFTNAACNNAKTDYWKMINSTSVVTSPAFDISAYTSVSVSVKWQNFGSFDATKCNATIKISTGSDTWYTLGTTGLTGASTKTAVFSDVETHSSYTSAQVQISTPNADGSVGGRLFIVEIKGEAAGSCSASPTVGNAANNGALVYSTTPMTVPITCPSIGAGSSCEIKDYGFVWKAGGNPSISDNKTQIGTDNHSTAFSGNISGTFAAGTTYYVKAYAINNGDKTTLSTGTYSFTPRSITFNSNGGSAVATILVLSGTAASEPTAPTKDGYTFGGWYTDSGLGTAVNWSSTITSNKTYYAKWNELPKYTVTLKDNDETLTQASAGATVTLPTRTGCTGYTFAGWTKTWGTAQTEWTTTAPTIIPAGSYTPSANENLYPVYTKVESGGTPETVTLYDEPFTGSAHSTGVESTNVAATTDMFVDGSATVWSHYSFNAASTTSFATNLDGSAMSNGVKIKTEASNTTVTMMEVTGIKISGASDLELSLYNRRSYTSATLNISYKIDDGSYTAVGGTISYNSTNDYWKKCTGLTISGTGTSLDLKIELVVSGTTNRTMVLDDIKITGETGGSTTYYISVPSCGAMHDITFKKWTDGTAAEGSPSTGGYTENATSFSFGATPPSYTGHQIEGFYTATNANSGVKVADGSRNFIASVAGWTDGTGKITKTSDINLYIKWEPIVTTITLDKGTDGTSDGTATVTYGASALTSITHAEKTGYSLTGYYTEASGGTKVLNDDGTWAGDNVGGYISGGNWEHNSTTLTLYAQWTINNYTINWIANGVDWTGSTHGSPSTDADYNTKPATIPTAPVAADCDDEKVFVGWTTGEYEHASVAPTMFTTQAAAPAITDNTTFYAVFATASGSSTDWSLVTSSSDALADGDDIIIASSGSAESAYAMGYQKSNNRDAESVTISAGPVISSPTLAALNTDEDKIYPMKLVKDGDYWLIKDIVNDKYLRAPGTSKNYLRCIAAASIDDMCRFTITIGASGAATVDAKDASVHGYMRFNNSDGLFSCYETSSEQDAVYFYRKSVSYADYTTACCQQPAVPLTMSSDKTELVKSGEVVFTLSGGNGQNITWSCVDEANTNCTSLLGTPTNSGATLTILEDVTTTKTYFVTATQPEDDDDAEVVCGKTVTMDITVKAQWTITFQTTDDGTPSTTTQTVTDGDSYTFPDLSDEYTCETNYSFVGWKATNTAGAPEHAAGSSATASGNTTWYAVWMYSTGTTSDTRDKYELVTSASTALAEDDVVVIACSGQGVALGQMTTSATYGSPVAVDFAADKSYLTFASGTNVMPLKLHWCSTDDDYSYDGWAFEDNSNDDQFLSYGDEDDNYNGTLTYLDGYLWMFNVSIDASGTATITDPDPDYSTYKLQYRKETTRFAFYSGSNKAVQLYRKNGTISVSVPATPTYYVNNEHCTNGATVRATDGQWVTSSKDQKVRITVPVTAKNFKTSGKQLSATSDNAHFAVTIPTHTIPSDKSEVVVNMVVEYTPIEANTIEEANITITTGTGDGNATKVVSVNGRSLPDEFVIVTYKDSKWQALPADMFNGSGTYTPITVTPNAGPTKVPSAPYTIIYSAREVAASRYATAGNCMRLVGNSNKCLWANSATNNSHIQDWAALGSTNGAQYEWLLTTTDGETYTIANPAHPDYATGRQLGIYTLKYGLYKTSDIFYLLPVDCSTLPGNLQITPRRVDAMFSWETNAASVTIDLWTNEAMSEGHKQAVVTSVPYQFTGLAESTQYWYKLTPDDDDDCAVTGTFSTTGPTIDLVEWGENSATIFVDKDEAVDPRIIIAGEVEHGQGGIVATDIFFSKYFEAEGTAKLLAIYNGTANAISLSDITILQRSTSSYTPLSLASYGKTAGWIQSGEEIILYNKDSRDAVMTCAENNPTYDSWINVENGNLAFSGKGTIRLFRGNTCIDIIGAMSAGDDADDMNDKTHAPMEGSSSPSFGDATGFVTAYGDNYETAAEETDYELSTNRCLLIRRAFVTSGDSALLNNYGDFKTLGVYTGVDSESHRGEWSGLQIPTAVAPDADYIHTCKGFEDAGSFDYNKYYKEFSQIGEDKYLSNFTRADDGTYTLPISNMYQYSCMNLKFQLTAHSDPEDVLTEQLVQVPIIVSGEHTTNDTLFNFIVRRDEAPKTPIEATSITRCKTCNVVILSDGVLTKATDGSTTTKTDPTTSTSRTCSDAAEVANVKVYPGGKLIVPEGTHYVINSLSLRRQEDEIASAKVDAGLSSDPSDVSAKGLYIRESNGVYLDVRIDPSNWHYFTLPYDCRVGDIRFSDGTPAKVNNDYLLGWYDGAYRAEHKEGGWTDITDDDYVLKKGLGYIVALPGNGLIKRELRFPMANEVISAELADKEVGGLYAYGGNKTDEELRPNHKGWNMIGNPYLYDYTTDIVKEPLAIGELKHDPEGSSWNGKWVRTGSARYIVAPIDNGWSGYEQTTISNMKPFMSYFIQIGTRTDGKDNPETERSILFDKDQKPASIIRRRAQAEDSESMWPVWYGIEMTAPNAEKDNTTLLISDEFTDGYDMMDDLIKMRGDYYKYYPYPVLASRNNEGEMAFNALPDASAAENGVPLNYYAAAAGTYTISTDSRYDLEEVKSAMLYDATNNTYIDLLAQNYEFTTAKGDNTNRFTLYVRVERKKAPEIATGTDNILTDGKLSLIAIDKTLVLSGLTDAADVYVYDMSGKMIKSEHGAGNGIWRATVPATGVYFVRVNSIDGQQTLRAIVK